MAVSSLEQLNDVYSTVTAETIAQFIATEIGKVYKENGYYFMFKAFMKKGMVATLEQAAKVTRCNTAGTITTSIEIGLQIFASGVQNPIVRKGCAVVGKGVGFVGQVYQMGGIGAVMGGPAGMVVGAAVGGGVWILCQVLGSF